jgi:hypothetical protein
MTYVANKREIYHTRAGTLKVSVMCFVEKFDAATMRGATPIQPGHGCQGLVHTCQTTGQILQEW